MPRNASCNVRTVAVTLRPRDGCTKHHEKLLYAWCEKYAEQYEFFIEFTGGEETRHLHGRILLTQHKWMDKIKDSLSLWLGLRGPERRNMNRGVKFLYDNWATYLTSNPDKDPPTPCSWNRIHTEEDWTPHYADPKNKTGPKKKNAEILHYLSFIHHDLDNLADVTEQPIDAAIVQDLLGPHFVNGRLDMPYLDQLKRKCQRIADFYNLAKYHNVNLDPDPPEEASDMDE